ncbi:hypothetical protein ACWD2L_00630 [Streptomyces sp. NPDC002754]
MSSGPRHYRVFVVETRTVEVEVYGARDDLDAQGVAERVAGGEVVEGGGVFRRHPVRRAASTTCWIDNPNRLG